MKQVLKKRFAILLALVMILSCMPDTNAVRADEPSGTDIKQQTEIQGIMPSESSRSEETEVTGDAEVSSGTCGPNLTWELDENGVLTVNGTGEMDNFNYDIRSPWGNLLVKEVIVEEGVTSIGKYAFFECRGINSVTIPESVKNIRESAFWRCEGLEAVYAENLESWCGIKFFNGYSNPVYYAHQLYLGGELLTNAKIPDGIKEISSSLFYGCTSLESVTIPGSVEIIGSEAFRYCSELTDISIPANVKKIGDRAFGECEHIENVHIKDLKAWFGIEFGDKEANPLNGAQNLYLNETVVTDLQVPSGITEINAYSFYHFEGLNRIIIPSGVVRIGDEAFRGCSNLSEILLPSSVTKFGRDAFSETAWIQQNLENGCLIINGELLYAENNMIPDGVVKIGDYVFANRSSLTEITIPDSVVSIGKYAFSETGLTEIIIPNTVNQIEAGAFYFSNLNKVQISDAEVLIGEKAFSWCGSLTDVSLGSNVTEIAYLAFQGCRVLPEITIPNSVSKIGEAAFTECESLKKVSFIAGDNSMVIEKRAFEYCKSLPEIIIPDSVESIETETFAFCEKLANIKIGASKIKRRAFAFCNNLQTIEFSSHVTEIENGEYGSFGVFSSMKKLESVVFLDSAARIGDAAFRGCDSLKSVSLGNSITEIGESAFSGCENLSEIIIPDSVQRIKEYAFPGSGKAVIKFKGNVPLYDGRIFSYYDKGDVGVEIYVPEGNATWTDEVRRKCGSDQKWGLWNPDTGQIIKKAEKLTEKDQTQQGAESSGSNQSQNQTQDNTIWQGKAKYSVTNADKKEVVYKQYDDKKASAVTIPDTIKVNGVIYSVTSIDKNAFKGNQKIKKVTIGKNVTNIGKQAFYNCKKLKDIKIKSMRLTMKSVGAKAFQGISSKAVIHVPSKKVSAYKKILKKKGVTGKKQKIKK